MFRKFHVEVGETIGSYDGRAIHVERGATKSHEVEVHESVHERIFYETLDGILHRLLVIAADTQNDADAASRSDLLMTETEHAHEAAATYLGVQSLDNEEERAQTLRQLPPEYQQHYRLMGDVITPLTTSTYLAYILGWSLAYWAFHSDRLYTVFDKGWSQFEAVISDIPSPTERMRIGAELLKVSGQAWLEAGLSEAAQSYIAGGILPWDVHDDDQWRAQPRPDLGRFESMLSANLWRWLHDNAPVRSATSDVRPEGFDRWLLGHLDVPADQDQLVVRDDAFDADPENDIIVAATAALRAGKARILNHDLPDIARLRTGEAPKREKALARFAGLSPASYFIGAARPVKGSGWAVYAFQRDIRPGLAPDESAMADRFIVADDFGIELLSLLQLNGPRKPHNGGLFLAPADAGLLPYYMERLEPLIGTLISGGAQNGGQSGLDYPLWYWMADWPDLLSMPGICTAARRVEPSATGFSETYMLHLARVPSVPGYFLRLSSPLPGNSIASYEALLKARNELGDIPDCEVMHVLKGLPPFIGIILDNWHLY